MIDQTVISSERQQPVLSVVRHLGPRASCPLCSEGAQVRSGWREQTGDNLREDAGKMRAFDARGPRSQWRSPLASAAVIATLDMVEDDTGHSGGERESFSKYLLEVTCRDIQV